MSEVPKPETPKRKPGSRKENYNDEDAARLLKVVKTQMMTHWGGGGDPIAVIQAKMHEKGVDCGPQAAAAIKALCEEQVASCRARVFPRLDEAITRLGAGVTTLEVLP